ncbi:protein FAM210A-like isoform X2 [Acanthaster planci]|uniref:Protein FAM210A-like isoform X2 n=1 Tax=Acanthaster planci TaxID=133434 RepID=A0A8B7XNN6_ACAPL|nr:protein FAM210A-like isoform X2 [Acanthaster planci]
MALFRNFSKFRAFANDVQTLTEGFCFNTRAKVTVVGTLDNSWRSLQLHTPVTSFTTYQYRVSDWHLLAHGYKPHPIVTDDVLISSSSSWGRSLVSGRGFQTKSHPDHSTLTQSSKTENGAESKTEKDAMQGKQEDLAPDAGRKDADSSVEARQDSEEQDEDDDDEPIVAKYDETGKPLSNWTRMKMMMKAYGYVIIPVHWVIAPFWFGAFYYTIKMGVDIAPFLLKIGISEHHVATLKNSGASNALMAYALYKIFTPLRYTVTVGATEMTVRYLRRKGYMKHPPRKEKTYRQSLKETVQEVKDRIDNRK